MKRTSRRDLLKVGFGGVVGSAILGNALYTGARSEAGRPIRSSREPHGLDSVRAPRERHWVGDGFHVSTMFSPHAVDPKLTSPFILMDYAAPRRFPPTVRRLGVGEHPHRGFETVTFAFRGEVAHRDSFGGGGTIGPGDLQWMTAGRGVVHEEFHSEHFGDTGGLFEMVQLWVNLPAKRKMVDPRYQAVLDSDVPKVELGQGVGRLFAGQIEGEHGPADTHSPMTLMDLRVRAGEATSFIPEPGYNTLIFVTQGRLRFHEGRSIRHQELVVLDRGRPGVVSLQAQEDSRVLVLSGEPIDEPLVAHGPFVMNSREEIIEAIEDYRRGEMGKLPPAEHTPAPG
ncbi:MAG: pirin family protein [Myxococcota bacterium]